MLAIFAQCIMELMEFVSQHVSWLYNCYDAETEILTHRGWVKFPALQDDDEVATVDPDTREMWFESPRQTFAYPYNGDMVHLKSSRVDLFVTPNHKIWAAKQQNAPNAKYADFAFIEADALCQGRGRQYQIPGCMKEWWGVEKGELVFDAVSPQRDRGKTPRYPEVRVPYSWLAPFLGWFVSEGSISKGEASGSYAVSVRQKKPQGIAQIDALMLACPFHVTRYEEGQGAVSWTITDKRLFLWLAEHCGQGAKNKKVPALVQTWGVNLLSAFLDAAIAGDGTRNRRYEDIMGYVSISQQLADDMSIIAWKLGCNVSVTEDAPTEQGKRVYRLNLNTRGSDYEIADCERNSTREYYCGTVYCVENSTHLVVVRRSGRITVCGQSHPENVRKSLNDRFLIDPSKVKMDDVLNPSAGQYVRLHPS